MPKEYFSLERAQSLDSIKPGSRIHVIGVAGVAMAQLALALVKLGYKVSGSDKEFYDPMGSILKNSSVELKKGYSAENISTDTNLVVIGNAISYPHDEVLEVERRGISYTLFPKLLYDIAIRGKHSVVVSGTHGKSTTSSMLAWLMTRMNLDPSYFIGAAVPGLPSSLEIGKGKLSVVEGDEYDSAFFAKVPKFTFYKPDTLIITSIEFDHADIYPNLEAIENEFTKLVLSLNSKQRVLCCIDCNNVRRLVESWKKKCQCEIVTYGMHLESNFRIVGLNLGGARQIVHVEFNRGGEYSFELGIPGAHNARNAASALLACLLNDLDGEEVCQQLGGFGGAKRRQELRVANKKAILIDDFAHHPTAVHETISAIRSFYPGHRLWAIFEPRSNTSRRKVFEQDYIRAFSGASRVVLCDVVSRGIDQGHELISVKALADGIGLSGIPAVALPDAKAICEYVIQHREDGDVILVMSNGGFNGLVDQLERSIRNG